MVEMTKETGLAPLGAYRLAYTRMGSGSPVVVLEAGGGSPRTIWDKVMPAVAGFTQVISYDRAGLGESEPAPQRRAPGWHPRTLADMTRDLKGVLDYLQAPGPYILVGHSVGGHIVRYFASLHPEQVAGLVFVDSSHPDGPRRTMAVLPPPAPDDSDFVKDLRFHLTHPGTYVDDPEHDPEGIDFGACDDQAREVRSLGALPLVVLAAGNHKKDVGDPINDPANVPVRLAAAFERAHLEAQADLTLLSTRARFIIAQNSGHYIHLHEPDLVIGVIQGMVDAYRAGSPGAEAPDASAPDATASGAESPA